MKKLTLTRLTLLSATAMAGLSQAPLHAQEATDAADAEYGDAIVVTATRRAVTLQDVPINISAMSSEEIAEQGLDDVRDLGAFTPGMTIVDTGPRNTGTIVLRGLAASDTSSTGDNNNDMLATYLGEVPLYLDIKFLDIDRVETLLGPQGTLYGSATMGGAIRYIPNRPNPDEWSGKFGGKVYDVAHASDPGFSFNGTINVPIVPGKIALRSTAGYYNDPGFIDYKYLLKQPGVSLPQPQASSIEQGSVSAGTPGASGAFFGPIGTDQQIADNFYSYKDANSELTYATRNQLGLFPFEGMNVYITYMYQQTKSNGRQANGGGIFETGKYEAPWRYLEPSNRKSHMISAEVELELGDIAQLVSSSAYSKRNIRSQQDVTDLLLDLDYDYELFPAFSGYTQSDVKYRQFTQEVRLVSTHGGPVSWVIGAFYNKLKYNSNYREIVPGFPDFSVSATGSSLFGGYYDGLVRPDEIEYISFIRSEDKEKAIFGEATLEPIQGLTLTAGARYYKYDTTITGGADTPLTGGGRARMPYPSVEIADVRIKDGAANDDGVVWKFNASYKFSPDLMVYGTYSKGYRIGGANRVVACTPEQLASGSQTLCALPHELFYGPDKVKNAEIGLRAAVFDRKLSFTLAAYHIDWSGIQLDSQTQYGSLGITVNGGKAVSKGIEFSFAARPVNSLRIVGSYSYNDAHLTQTVPGLIQQKNPEYPGTRPDGSYCFFFEGCADKYIYLDAMSGDRLPGSTKNSGSLGITYTVPMGDADIDLNWTAIYQGNILTRVGGRGGGEKLPSYTLHRAYVSYKRDDYEVKLYVDNIFDKYAVASVGNDLTRRVVNDYTVSRYYARNVISPRKMGIEFSKKF